MNEKPGKVGDDSGTGSSPLQAAMAKVQFDRQNEENKFVQLTAALALANDSLRAEQARRELLEARLTKLEASLAFYRTALAEREWHANNVAWAELLLEECPPDLRSWGWQFLKHLCRPEIMTLSSNGGSPVQGVDFSPDGKRLAAGYHDGSAKVWDCTSGKTILSLEGHGDKVTCVAFSPNGRRLASGSHDRTIKIWDFDDGRELLTIRDYPAPINGIAFSPDGKRLAAIGRESAIIIWDAVIGCEIRSLAGHTAAVAGVVFSPDGQHLATAGFDQTVRIWDAAAGREIATLKGHASGVTGLAFSPDSQRLVSGSGVWVPSKKRFVAGELKVWNVATGQELLALSGHTNTVTSVAFSPDGQWIASGSLDQTVKVWSASADQSPLTFQGHTNMVRGVAFSPDGKWLASASWDGTVKVWDATPMKAPDKTELRA